MLSRTDKIVIGSIDIRKIYKFEELDNKSNLRIVSMNPGDSQKLPDAYIFSEYLGGLA